MTSDPQNTVAFMGVAGTNGDLACRQKEPYMHTLPLPNFEDVMQAVEEGNARYGMIPVENSQAGRVAEIHGLLPKTSLSIVGEHIQRIEHFLCAPSGATKEGIRHVHSHPQALLQCRTHLREMRVQMHPHSDTASAARDVAAWGDPAKAAVCTRLAAELYGLEVLIPNLEDAGDNLTVFLVFSKEPVDPEPEDGRTLTSLLFELRNIPAALYKSLGGFATNGVNIIKLESYIKGGGSTDSHFFITFEGNPKEPRVQRALEELGFFSKKVRVLGVYLADPKRREG